MSRREQSTRGSFDGSIHHSSQSEMRQQESILPRSSLSRRSTNLNVFSDDYSLESLGTTDAIPPLRTLSISSNDSSSTLRFTQPAQPTSRQSYDNDSVNPFADDARSSLDEVIHRSSVHKGNGPNRQSSVTTTSSMSFRPGSRPLSMSIPRAMSPYHGATGPSHPYAMYPQVGVSRSASIATTSTVRAIDAPLQGRTAPQHPYAMYQQGTELEDGVGDQAIPMGFPDGSSQPYQRTPAQADDVGDIIGPDGHLEQLPPYSRYPDGVPLPKVGMGPASIVSAYREQEQPLRNESPEPTDVSSRTLVNVNSTEPVAASVETGSTRVEPVSFEEKWTKRGRQTCCGAPVWLLALLGLGMLIGSLIGGVIGGVLGERRAEERSAARHASAMASASLKPSVVTVTYTSDVTPLPTIPTNIPQLPTGKYVVPANIKNQSKFCITSSSSSYTSSWGCQDQGSINVEVEGSNTQGTVTIPAPQIDGSFTYGAQPPFLSTPTQDLRMMLDKDDVELGPALFFAASFDKLVIVPENVFPTPTGSASKRSVNELDLIANQWRRKQVAQSGDMPWFCWWNTTAMEFFVYVNETSSGTTAAPASASATMTGSPSSTSGSNKGQSSVNYPNYPRRVKIEEKRAIPSSPQPYCVQMEVGNGVVTGPIPSTQVNINEVSTASHKRDVLSGRDSVENSCYCEWLTD